MNRTHLFLTVNTNTSNEKRSSYTVWLPIEFYGFRSRINSKGYHSLVPCLKSQFFTDGMGPFKEMDFDSLIQFLLV